MNIQLAKIAAAAVLLCSATVQAADYRVDFTATDFYPFTNSGPAPQSIVSGSVIITAASPDAEATAIKYIDLVINNHTYTLAEIGLASYSGIGGILNGPDAMGPGSDDFFLAFPSSSLGSRMVYTTADISGVWKSTSVTTNYTLLSAVPEPEGYALLLGGLGILGLVSRRRRLS